jgi:hypothetical protein
MEAGFYEDLAGRLYGLMIMCVAEDNRIESSHGLPQVTDR